MKVERLVGLALLFVHRDQRVSISNTLDRFADYMNRCIGHLKKMGDFIEQGTHRSTIIKITIKTLLKKSEMYFSYRIESKDIIYAFSNCSDK